MRLKSAAEAAAEGMTLLGSDGIIRADMLSRRSIALTVSAAVLAVPLAVLILWLWERLSTEPSARFEGVSFQLLSGEGGFGQGGLELRQVGPNGQGIMGVRIRNLPAEKFGEISFSMLGLENAQGAGVYWHRKSDPGVSHARALSIDEVRNGRARLDVDPQWVGEIQTFGFIVQGPIKSAVVLRSLGFVPDNAAVSEVFSRLVQNWTSVTDWGGGSVNFYIGAERDERRLTPVAFGLTWLFSGLLIFLILRRMGWVNDDELPVTAVAVAGFLVVWAALDLRWQVDLWQRHFVPTDDALVAADERRAKLWAEVRPRLFNAQSRVFIVSDDPSGYLAYRTRYHLGATRSSFGMLRLPNVAERRAGDLILILGSREPLQVDRSKNLLFSPSESVPATLVFNSPELGTVFRVLGGGSP
jgi:hypothetical protein